MARPLPWRKEDDVNLLAVSSARIARAEDSGGVDDPAQPVCVNGGIKIGCAAAPFDFDKGKDVAAPGDDIDLPAMHLLSLRQYPPAFQTQIPAGQNLTPPAARLGLCARHALPDRVKARA